MAYLDKGAARPGAASVIGALAINGAMVAAIIYSVPDMLPQPVWTILEIYPVTPEPIPAPPKDPEKPVVKAKGRDSFVPPVISAPDQPDETMLTRASGGTEPSAGGIAPLPLPVPNPVFKGAQINPRYAAGLQPAYPPGMIREEREGVVTVRVLVGVDGRVKAFEAVRADAPAFLEATRKQALAKWRFLPATRDGEPVESWREMTVRFELPG
jgi:protein TonB